MAGQWSFTPIREGCGLPTAEIITINKMQRALMEIRKLNTAAPLQMDDWHIWLSARLDQFVGQGDSIPIGDPTWSAPWVINYQGGSGPSGPGTITFGPNTVMSAPSAPSGAGSSPVFYWGGPVYFPGTVTFGGTVIGLTSGLQWVKYTIPYTNSNLTVAATSSLWTLRTLDAGTVLHAVKMNITQTFTGPTNTVMDIGFSGGSGFVTNVPTQYVNGLDVHSATSQIPVFSTTNQPDTEDQSGTWNLTVRFRTSAGDLDTLTTGSIDVWFLLSVAV